LTLRPRSGARLPEETRSRQLLPPGRRLSWPAGAPAIALAVLIAAGVLAVALQVGLRQPDRGPGGGAQLANAGASPAAGSPQAPAVSQGAAGGSAALSGGASQSPAASPPATGTPRAGEGLPGAAPTSASGFSLRHTVVSIRFPLKSSSAYSYSDNFLVRRVGTLYSYNHALPAMGGGLSRAHDGVDIYVPLGTPVLSPFDGAVIDPAARWKPWVAARYGIVAVIASAEPTSRGYVAILAHLSVRTVKPGDRVQRGQVLGRTGRTGNAEATRPHLHFELRAPFRLRVKVGTLVRRVDAFDPYPSLVAADPRRRSPAAA
jgi:murein DD-endopeptidase MepM/ murein hydrolase activator NlpD